MAGKREEGDRACRCHAAEASCAGLHVRRLSSERVRELAEEIWTASTGRTVLPRPALDPRASRPGASAQAAYQRCRQQELADWRKGLWWRMGVVVIAAVTGGLLIGITVGAWLGWPLALVAGLATWWRLRFRPSVSASVWRRQAAMQRRAAGALRSLEEEGYLVLHDLTLPAWSASLDHLVIGPTGVWVIQSWRRRRLPRPRWLGSPWRPRAVAGGVAPEVRWEAAAIADILADGSPIPVRALLCAHGGTLAGVRRSFDGIQVTTRRQLADVVRHGSPLTSGEVQQATTRALELLRPAV
jgi:hypothetical protein